MSEIITRREGIIGWFVRNHVAANLMMFAIIGLGLYSGLNLRQQTTPDFDLNYVSVRVPYLGAAPEEVEEGVVIKIEEAIQDTKGIKKIKSTSSEGLGSVRAEVEIGADINEVLNEIKAKVDAISTFPELTEKPVVYKVEIPTGILFVSIYGNLDEYQRELFSLLNKNIDGVIDGKVRFKSKSHEEGTTFHILVNRSPEPHFARDLEGSLKGKPGLVFYVRRPGSTEKLEPTEWPSYFAEHF